MDTKSFGDGADLNDIGSRLVVSSILQVEIVIHNLKVVKRCLLNLMMMILSPG